MSDELVPLIALIAFWHTDTPWWPRTLKRGDAVEWGGEWYEVTVVKRTELQIRRMVVRV